MNYFKYFKKATLSLVVIALIWNTTGCSQKKTAVLDTKIQVNKVENTATKDSSDEHSSYVNTEAENKYGNLSEFDTVTVSGNNFNQDNFKGYDITMVNIWATECGACLEEMKELGELARELPTNVNMISICDDAKGNEELVNKIIKDKNMTFPVLKASPTLRSKILQNIMYLPTTIFVDSSGRIVGKVMIGAPENVKQEYSQAIEDALSKIEKATSKTDNETSKDNTEAPNNNGQVPIGQEYDDEQSYVLPETLSDYIIGYENILTSEIQAKLEKRYAEIYRKNQANELMGKELNTQLGILDSELRDNGVYLPFATIMDILNTIKDMPMSEKVTVNDIIDSIFNPDGSMSPEDEEKLIIKGENILKKYSISFNELTGQLMNQNYLMAVYKTDGDKTVLDASRNAHGGKLSKEQHKTFLNVINAMKRIVPQSIWKMIKTVEFNTDGVDNVGAHTVPNQDKEFTKNVFRLAMDTKDTINSEGKLTQFGKETIIHETGHMLTLGTKQVKPLFWESADASVEDRYKKGSYIMDFYNKFWKQRIVEFNKMKEESGDTFKYYDKYQGEFVSDYAATNTEEDIAESFRVFVMKDKPSGNSIVDQKLLFFYDYPVFVKARAEYREKMKID